MKTTKKILSIVLAVMLLVGTVVVGVSAETMVFEKAGSKLTYTATVAGKEANAEGVIELIPGETITVSVYAQANYYLGTTGSEIFCWTTGFFNTFTEADVTIHNYVNNYTPNKKVISASSATQLGTGYKDGGYEGYLHGRAYSTDCTSPYDASTATLAYTFTFTVPETATIGAKGEFLMPETCSATVATTSRMKQIYAAVNNSATAYGSSSLGSQYPETIDLTGTILNFEVVDPTPAEVPCDYAALDAAIESAATADTDNCTAASVERFNNALAAANAVARDMIADDEGTNQKTIDDATAELVAAIAGLTKLGNCDYAALDAAIAQAKALDENDYTTTSWYSQAYLPTYLEAAEAVARDMIADEAGENQATIDEATDALLAAIANLELRADFTALKAALASAATADTANCTSASVAEFNAALAAAQELADFESSTGVSKQSEVDAAAERLNKAIAGLTKLGACNYAELDAAIAAYEAKLADKDLYTNWAEYEAAYNAAKAIARDMIADEAGANQKAIDDAAAALNAVVLTYKAADYAKVDEAIAAAAAIDASKYTSASVKAVNDAVAAVVTGYDITKQADVDAMAKAINDAIANLVPLDPCDYDALDEAIATTPEYTEEYYDAADYAAYEAALAAAKAVERDMLADEAGANQAKIDAAAKALNDAIDALVPVFVDRSALEAALALTPAYGAEYYDAAAYLAWQDAVAAGRDSYDGLDGEPDVDWAREEVAAAADAINSAFAKLVPAFIDYSALEEAVKNYGTTPEAAESYTSETYEPYASALERAKEMLAEKDENAPASDTELAAQIAAAAKELEETFKALELSPVEPPALTIVTSVKSTEEYYQVGDTVNFEFDCAITNVTKLQVVFANGSTLTYHRAHSAVVSIVDNGDGTETWTIALPIYYDNMDATARGKLDRVWEDEGCAFEFETKTEESKEDVSVKSAEVLLNGTAVSEFTATDTVVLKIVCGPDTLRIRLVDQTDGGTSTYNRTKATQDENGNWVWLITRTFGVRAYAYDIYTADSSNYLKDEGTDLTFTSKAYVPYVGPSTGNDADIVVSAAVAKARIIRDAQQTFTIVTDKDAKGVRVTDQYGNVQAYSKDAATAVDNGDGTLTWTLTVVCSHADTYNCTVEALYGSEWMSNGTTVSYRVIY